MMWLYRTGQSADMPGEVGCLGSGYIGPAGSVYMTEQVVCRTWIFKSG